MKTMKFLSLIVFLMVYSQSAHSRFSHDILRDTFAYDEDTKSSVKISSLIQGCKSRDCIPSIDKPQFGKISDITILSDQDSVILVDYNGIQKAYPLKMMLRHEIVNDMFADKPLAVTYCPLCASAVAFIPEINEKFVEFGVSGLLHNSDLVMYDRKTMTLWGQMTGLGILGPLTGHKLKQVYVAQILWSQAKQYYPKLLVLLPHAGHHDLYKNDPYTDYQQSDETMFAVPLRNNHFKQKTKIHGFSVAEQPVAIEAQHLDKTTRISIRVNGKPILVQKNVNGTISVTDTGNGEKFIPTETYWFAWYNFHPTTLIIP